MDTIYNVSDFTDDDLKQLMKKYQEKQDRYDLLMNEATDRNNLVINRIYQEQVKRLTTSLSTKFVLFGNRGCIITKKQFSIKSFRVVKSYRE